MDRRTISYESSRFVTHDLSDRAAATSANAFLRDNLHGGGLVVLTLSLVVFAVHVPVLIGFTVARYAEPEEATAASASPTR
jgi:hypothetical protein